MSDINFSEYFYYDETSPSCLRWRVDVWRGPGKCVKGISAGAIAGGLTKQGYWVVTLNNKYTLVHRIIAALHGLKMEGYVIDHVDGDGSNNKIGNLRSATQQVNLQNRKMNSTNYSGVTGVSWKQNRPNNTSGGATYAVANWRENGKNGLKYFAVLTFGLLPAFAMAVAYREQKIAQLVSDGMAYTERHGKCLPV